MDGWMAGWMDTQLDSDESAKHLTQLPFLRGWSESECSFFCPQVRLIEALRAQEVRLGGGSVKSPYYTSLESMGPKPCSTGGKNLEQLWSFEFALFSPS